MTFNSSILVIKEALKSYTDNAQEGSQETNEAWTSLMVKYVESQFKIFLMKNNFSSIEASEEIERCSMEFEDDKIVFVSKAGVRNVFTLTEDGDLQAYL